jgi:hypothetical protein
VDDEKSLFEYTTRCECGGGVTVRVGEVFIRDSRVIRARHSRTGDTRVGESRVEVAGDQLLGDHAELVTAHAVDKVIRKLVELTECYEYSAEAKQQKREAMRVRL